VPISEVIIISPNCKKIFFEVKSFLWSSWHNYADGKTQKEVFYNRASASNRQAT
jgi:hypothetical protein